MPDTLNPMISPIGPPTPNDVPEPAKTALSQVSTDIRLLHTLRRQQVKCVRDGDFIHTRGYEREVDALVCRVDGFIEALSCVGAIDATATFMYRRAASAAQRPFAVDGPHGGTSKAYNDWRIMVERAFVDSALTSGEGEVGDAGSS